MQPDSLNLSSREVKAARTSFSLRAAPTSSLEPLVPLDGQHFVPLGPGLHSPSMPTTVHRTRAGAGRGRDSEPPGRRGVLVTRSAAASGTQTTRCTLRASSQDRAPKSAAPSRTHARGSGQRNAATHAGHWAAQRRISRRWIASDGSSNRNSGEDRGGGFRSPSSSNSVATGPSPAYSTACERAS